MRNSGIAENYRASPTYAVVVYDRLPESLRGAVASEARASSFYGLLLPHGDSSARAPRTLDQDTALLLLTLREPGPIPVYVSRRLGARANDVVRSLVLDGVLEVEQHGTFVSGAAALDQTSIGKSAENSVITKLSDAALQHAQWLAVDNPRAIAERLYLYNRIPLTPRWANELGDTRDVLRFLGCEDRRTAKCLARAWTPASPGTGWISWTSSGGRRSTESTQRGKLYVSPRCDELPKLFPILVDVLEGLGAPPFKVGVDAAGLLRPDKLVIYFQDVVEMQRCADALVRALGGAHVQGVPFTTAASSDGLVSWGVDPPRNSAASERGTSWRAWITAQLAGFLASARAAPNTGVEPWQFARERVRALGVDPDSWRSATTLWSGNFQE